MNQVICSNCGKVCVPDGVGTGYARLRNKKKICYDCCGKRDSEMLKSMAIGEKTSLYLSKSYIINWPGTLKIKVLGEKTGRHNLASIRKDVWFDFSGNHFHGVCYGRDNEICHIQRIKG